ncbi:membrane protein [Arthrobacter phage Crewmate]|uniref:Membrane protein n=1 Tax=Arthrobacter phage Crewmate TaxID=2832317 RepID=A0AA48Y3K3_9CAUD|nr:membrane protein [Arthrobacter phage Crewmate]UIW13286.1 membrane protein [Arthrobacter phage Crewmate]WGH21209.1 membrane protein [Arthrobacter phage ObiToo]
MGLLAAILWACLVLGPAWENLGLPPLAFWDGLLVLFLGVALIATVERN